MRFNPAITAIEEEGAFAVLDRANVLRGQGRDIINLGIGQPDFSPPTHILEAAEKAVREGPHGYTSPVGIAPLRQAVADHVGGRYGVEIDPDQVVVVPGGKVTFYFACMLFGGGDSDILYPDPGFPPYREAIRAAGANPVAYPVREELDFSFRADEVLSLITPKTRLVILNSPANPTGGVSAGEEMARLAEGLADHRSVAILSDEIYSHLVFDGADFVSALQFPSWRERLIMLDGWSKTFAMTGWRLGYGIWPRAWVEHVRKLITVDHSCVNAAAQAAGVAALTGPWEDVDGFRSAFARRARAAADALNGIDGVTCRMPAGAFYVFPNVSRTGHRSQALAHALLEEAGVAVIAGDSFGANGAGYLRLSCAASETDIAEAIARIARWLHENRAP